MFIKTQSYTNLTQENLYKGFVRLFSEHSKQHNKN
jgi:hypothetical protein